MEEPPPLEVVVVTYRAGPFIAKCLQSVRDYTPRGTLTHIVDNASPDDTVAIIREHFKDMHLEQSPTNLGFAVANNRALRRVVAPYVLVLNPDAVLASGVIDSLLAHMGKDPGIGVLGCRLVQEDGTFDHAAKRFIPSPLEAAQYFLGSLFGRSRSRYTAPEVGEHAVGEIDSVNGAFMLVRKEAMDEVGLFDERYWMYAEDLDWCLRFRMAGWKVVYDGTVTARHLKGASAGIRSPKLNYEFHRSMALFYRSHLTTGALSPLVIIAIWLKFAVTTSVDGVRRLTIGDRS